MPHKQYGLQGETETFEFEEVSFDVNQKVYNPQIPICEILTKPAQQVIQF